MAKAATHHLMESFSLMEGSGSDARIANVILPMTIDTPMNRQFIPDADFGTWSCPTEIAEEILSWVDGSASPPPSGSYVDITTAGGTTSFARRE